MPAYPTHGVALPPGSGYGSVTGMGISPPYSDFAPSYQGSTLGHPADYSRSRSSSFSYPQQVYPSQQAYPPQQAYPQQVYPQQVYPQQVYSQQGYPATPYAMGSAMSTSSMGMPAAAPTTIIIHKNKKHKHRGHRSRSSDPDYHGVHHSSSSRY